MERKFLWLVALITGREKYRLSGGTLHCVYILGVQAHRPKCQESKQDGVVAQSYQHSVATLSNLESEIRINQYNPPDIGAKRRKFLIGCQNVLLIA